MTHGVQFILKSLCSDSVDESQTQRGTRGLPQRFCHSFFFLPPDSLKNRSRHALDLGEGEEKELYTVLNALCLFRDTLNGWQSLVHKGSKSLSIKCKLDYIPNCYQENLLPLLMSFPLSINEGVTWERKQLKYSILTLVKDAVITLQKEKEEDEIKAHCPITMWLKISIIYMGDKLWLQQRRIRINF